VSLRIGFLRILTLSVLILAGLVPGARRLQADVIYTNFGTGDTYSAGSGLIVTNDNQAWSSLAVAFTPLANYNLTSIEFVATELIPDDTGAMIGIFADNNGQPGGAPLESFALGPLGMFGNTAPVMTVTSILQPLLFADTQYWIGMQGPAGGFIVWNQNLTLADGYSQTDGSGNWSTSNADQGVLEIDGSLSPDQSPPVVVDPDAPPTSDSDPPDTSALLLSSQTTSQTEEFASVTPEPAAWWLMAGGLLAIAGYKRLTARRLKTR